MASKLLRTGDLYSIEEIDSVESTLPPGNYVLFATTKGYRLRIAEPFSLPKRIYGADQLIIERWKKAWNASNGNLGILLNGLKGCGKTLLAKKFCMDLGLPVIIVTKGHSDEEFVQFLANPVLRNCVIFIDEFEKLYESNSNSHRRDDEKADISALLQLMDGVVPSKFLFLMTTNSPDISEYLINRPGRVKYRLDFSSISDAQLKEVIDDLLVHKQHEKSIYEAVEEYDIGSFDILTKLIEDINLFDEDALTVAGKMNLIVEKVEYEITIHYNNKQYGCFTIFDCTPNFDKIEGLPLEYKVDDYSALVNKLAIDYKVPQVTVQGYVPKIDHLYIMRYRSRITQIDKNTWHIKDVNLFSMPQGEGEQYVEVPVYLGITIRKLSKFESKQRKGNITF